MDLLNKTRTDRVEIKLKIKGRKPQATLAPKGVPCITQ